MTQDKPGNATATCFLVNRGGHDLHASIAEASLPTGLEWSAIGNFTTVSEGGYAEIELTFTTAGLEAKEHQIELAVTGNTPYTLPHTQTLTTFLTINAPAVGSKSTFSVGGLPTAKLYTGSPSRSRSAALVSIAAIGEIPAPSAKLPVANSLGFGMVERKPIAPNRRAKAVRKNAASFLGAPRPDLLRFGKPNRTDRSHAMSAL